MVRVYQILVTGSGKLSRHLVQFTRALGARMMCEKDLVLVTGGLRQLSNGVSTVDYEVVRGALEQLRSLNGNPRERILTLVPEEDYERAERFHDGDVRMVTHSNHRSRRFEMVRVSDAIIAIEGHRATRENIDLAWTFGKPLLPVACTGGNAEEAWKRYGAGLRQTLRIHEEEVQVLESGLDNPCQLADCCIAVLRRTVRTRCFSAMKFDGHPAPWAYRVIEEVAREKCYEPVRVDKMPGVGDIVDTIWSGIKSSDSFIADISGDSPNVFYELGIAHALRKDVAILLYSLDGNIPRDIPFDIRTHRVIPYRDEESLRAALERELPNRCGG